MRLLPATRIAGVRASPRLFRYSDIPIDVINTSERARARCARNSISPRNNRSRKTWARAMYSSSRPRARNGSDTLIPHVRSANKGPHRFTSAIKREHRAARGDCRARRAGGRIIENSARIMQSVAAMLGAHERSPKAEREREREREGEAVSGERHAETLLEDSEATRMRVHVCGTITRPSFSRQ